MTGANVNAPSAPRLTAPAVKMSGVNAPRLIVTAVTGRQWQLRWLRREKPGCVCRSLLRWAENRGNLLWHR